MTASTINLPLYRTLVSFKVSEADASLAADISDLVRKEETADYATKADLTAGFADMRAETRLAFADMRADTKLAFAETKSAIDALRLHMETTTHSQTKWLISTVLATAGLSIATIVLLLRLFPPH